MKKIVFFSTPAFGHINAVFPVIKKLLMNNYQVDWYCSKRFKRIVENTGANFIEYEIDFDMYSLSELTADFYNLYQGLLNLNRECYLEYIEKIDKEKPDLIIYDSMCSFAKNIAKKLNIKSVCFCTTIAYNFFTFTFSNMFFSTIKLLFKNLNPIMKLYNEEKRFRRENNIIKLNAMDLFINKGDLTIVFTPKELQPFYKTFSKKFVFVGTTIKDRITNKTNYDKYDIYISLGSIFTENKVLLKKIVDSPLMKNKKSIVNVGNLKIKSSENIEFVQSTDQLSLLPKIKLFINHGGINSIYESLYYGKFQICIPQQQEQKLNAKILHRKKIGIYMNKFDIEKVDKINKKMKKYNANISIYSKILKSYDGTTLAVNEIKSVLK